MTGTKGDRKTTSSRRWLLNIFTLSLFDSATSAGYYHAGWMRAWVRYAINSNNIMLPQTRQKLRVFSLISLIVGCLLLAGIWFSTQKTVVVKDTREPTFWQIMFYKSNVHDEIEWQVMDVKMSTEDFSDLLHLVLILTVTASALSLVVVFQDIRLTKK